MTDRENPYEPPSYAPPVVSGLKENVWENLRKLAFCQKGVMVCLAVYLLVMLAAVVIAYLDSEHELSEHELQWTNDMLGILALIDIVLGTIFVFRLSTLVYGVAVGILMGLLTLIPCLGLFLLVLTNGVATATLRRNGIRVGLLGANLRQFTSGSLGELP